MQYYSKVLKKLFDTEEDCLAAEDKYEQYLVRAEQEKKEKEIAKESRKKEVEEAYKALVEARKTYDTKVKNYIKDYGYYYSEPKDNSSMSLLDWLNLYF